MEIQLISFLETIQSPTYPINSRSSDGKEHIPNGVIVLDDNVYRGGKQYTLSFLEYLKTNGYIEDFRLMVAGDDSNFAIYVYTPTEKLKLAISMIKL